MQIKYRIIEVHPEIHSIVVRFYTAKVTEEHLALERAERGQVTRAKTDYSITLFQVPQPTGQALHDYILKHAPFDFLKLAEAIKDPAQDTTMAASKQLIGQEFTADEPTPPQPAGYEPVVGVPAFAEPNPDLTVL